MPDLLPVVKEVLEEEWGLHTPLIELDVNYNERKKMFCGFWISWALPPTIVGPEIEGATVRTTSTTIHVVIHKHAHYKYSAKKWGVFEAVVVRE